MFYITLLYIIISYIKPIFFAYFVVYFGSEGFGQRF